MKRSVDKWSLDFNLNVFLQNATLKDWRIYDLKYEQDHLTFYASLLNRKSILSTFPQAKRLYTCGILGMLYRSFMRIDRWVALFCCLFCWWFLSMTTFEIEIQGEGEKNRQTIQAVLDQADIHLPIQNLNKNKLKEILNEHLKEQFTWLEVHQQGSALTIRFLPKLNVMTSVHSRDELIAKKDGMIAFFDLKHGEKKVAIHDIVHQGDVLVENHLLDSMNKEEELFVEGKVFAYTWKDLVLEADGNHLPSSINYFRMLLKARRNIAEEIDEGEKIIQENVLQFSSNEDKIILKVHYTLYEDISS